MFPPPAPEHEKEKKKKKKRRDSEESIEEEPVQQNLANQFSYIGTDRARDIYIYSIGAGTTEPGQPVLLYRHRQG